MLHRRATTCLFVLFTTLAAAPALAGTTYSENFKGKSANLQWTALDDACLTAGDGSGSIPSCASLGIDVAANEKVVGQGALLLTPASNMQTGAILSAFPPFPLSQGIQITFTTYTFGGNNGGTAHNGADGIVFFLTDGTKDAPTHAGGSGGSMGYGCSNGNKDAGGIAYGYLGLGIDEFGNFLNSGDNGSEGVYNSRNWKYGTKDHGDNSYQNDANSGIKAGAGSQYQPERIGLRGRGNTNWAWLHDQNRHYYRGTYNENDSDKVKKMQWVCEHGKYVSHVDWDGDKRYEDIAFNYNPLRDADGDAIGYYVLPNSKPIANNNDDATRNPGPNTPAGEIAWPITYRLRISRTGLLNFAVSYKNGTFQTVLAHTDITESNGELPASLRFGFSAGTGGSNNVHEITCFKAAPLQSNSSAAANTVTGKVEGNTQFFLAAYSSNNWWGSLVADPLIIDPVTDELSIGTVSNWDAKCVLTGGPCASMGTDASGKPLNDVTVQDPDTRVLLTSSEQGAGNGIALKWDSLDADQQTALDKDVNGTIDTLGSKRVEWLRGDRSNEQLQSDTGQLRSRTYVLGDIINSSPTFVGAPLASKYPDKLEDKLYGTTTDNNYSTFVANQANRMSVVYAGSNDGFLHGFRAGKLNGSTGELGGNDGHEVIGYVPYGVLMNDVVALSDPHYSHDYLVDATPATGAVYYGDSWHTWLVSGVGSGGKEIYALDITNPSGFSEANHDSLVIGDWDNASPGLSHLGNTVGTPAIVRMHNGDWAFIFASGLGSGVSEGVYIGLIDSNTGSVSFNFLDTGVTPAAHTAPDGSTLPGGMAYVSAIDLDDDHIVDYLYAGDTDGNVWRFDVTGQTSGSWIAAGAARLFTATDASGNSQPITTRIAPLKVAFDESTTRVMLYFGTGQQTQKTASHAKQYASGSQAFYGVWDWDMSNWNSLNSSPDDNVASVSGNVQALSRSNLLQRTTVAELSGGTDPAIKGYRTFATDKIVCWKGGADADCSNHDQYGWMYDLTGDGPTSGVNVGEGEQIVYSPTLIGGTMVVNTAIPPQVSAFQCNPGLQSGWTISFNPRTGGGLAVGFFADPQGNFSKGTDDHKSTVSAIKMNGVGKPTAVHHKGKHYLLTQTSTGDPVLQQIHPPVIHVPKRVSWRELVSP